ncbi:MAG: hypothetical protein FWG87_00865 [Defluviitaleaceae bacterium]|nr:hypothetical protein [Defluviitaleaceae bacterium]
MRILKIMERGFPRIWRILADFKTTKRGFTQIMRILSGLSDFRGLSHEPIRVIRENPLNPCEALESIKSA